MNSSDFGKFICQLRKEQGLTQMELAEKINVSDKAISRWENGKKYPDIEILEDLCGVLGISISELIACKRIESNEEAISITEHAYIDELIRSRKKKRTIKTLVGVFVASLLVIFIAFFVYNSYGDDIYSAIAFSESEVVQINENVYRVPKDNTDAFMEYMANQGWSIITQYGEKTVFEKGDKKANCKLEMKNLYAVYNVSYASSIRSIEQLLKDCPEYFFDYDNSYSFLGVEIYVWQMAEDSFCCGALPLTNRDKTHEEIFRLGFNPVSVEEMKSILTYCGIPTSECIVYPCQQPISSYLYNIDDEYVEKIEALFR